MTANDFVRQLKDIPLTIDKDAQRTLTESFTAKHLKSYTFIEKESLRHTEDPVIDLVLRYDGSQVEIGMVSFRHTLAEDKNYVYFGKYEADDLVINKRDGKVQLKQFDIDHILGDCAVNSSSFLDALYAAAVHLGAIPLGADIDDDQEKNCRVALECAHLAGGQQFCSFYNMLVGCDE